MNGKIEIEIGCLWSLRTILQKLKENSGSFVYGIKPHFILECMFHNRHTQELENQFKVLHCSCRRGAKYTLKWYCRRLSTLVKIVLFVCILKWIHACVKEVGSLRKFLRRGCDLAESPSAMHLCWAGDKISKNIVGNHLPTIIIMENTRSTAHLYSWGVLRSCKLLQITLLTFKWELLNTFSYL